MRFFIESVNTIPCLWNLSKDLPRTRIPNVVLLSRQHRKKPFFCFFFFFFFFWQLKKLLILMVGCDRLWCLSNVLIPFLYFFHGQGDNLKRKTQHFFSVHMAFKNLLNLASSELGMIFQRLYDVPWKVSSLSYQKNYLHRYSMIYLGQNSNKFFFPHPNT